jgi:hypothetical protein
LGCCAYSSHPAIWHHPVEIPCIIVEKRESAIFAQLVNIAPIQSWDRDVSERTTDWRRIGVNWCGASHCGTRFAGGAVFHWLSTSVWHPINIGMIFDPLSVSTPQALDAMLQLPVWLSMFMVGLVFIWIAAEIYERHARSLRAKAHL